MIILRQKNYSEDDKKMSTGKKVALGIGGTALTAGLAFAGARGGAFGGRAQMAANKSIAKAGKAITEFGKRTMESGVKGYGKGAKAHAVNQFASKNAKAIEEAGGLIQAGGNRVGRRAQTIATNRLLNELS